MMFVMIVIWMVVMVMIVVVVVSRVMGPQKYDGVAVPKVIILPPASHWRAVEAKDTSCESADMEKGPYSAETDFLYN